MTSSCTTAIGTLPTDVQGVLDRLHAIQLVTGPVSSAGKRIDGLAAFNSLYTTITTEVQKDLENGRFRDSEFLATLDVEFAKRYFDALVEYEAGHKDSHRSWSVLLDHRRRSEIQDLQFAVSGVYVHVNVDLTSALLNTWQLLGQSPTYSDKSPNFLQHEDYLRVNNIFHREMSSLRRKLEDANANWFDRGNVTHLLSAFSDQVVVKDRQAAWALATRIFANEADRSTVEDYLDVFGVKVNAMLLHADDA